MMLSAYLDVAILEDHIELFSPHTVDVLMGGIMKYTIGCQAKNKLFKRCLNIVSGNIISYYRVLNNLYGMIHINEYNHLASLLASIHDVKDRDKEEGKQKNIES